MPPSYMICAKTFTNYQRMWDSPRWFGTRVHPAESPVSASDRKRGHPGKSGQAHGMLLPSTPPATNHFLLRGFPELVHIIVSTSLAKSSGNLYAAKPLATTMDINQAELESVTIIGKKINL